jgi:aspartokinase
MLLAIIRSGLTIPDVIQKTFDVITPYIIRLVYYDARNSSIGILVRKNDAEKIAKILHKKLLETKI